MVDTSSKHSWGGITLYDHPHWPYSGPARANLNEAEKHVTPIDLPPVESHMTSRKPPIDWQLHGTIYIYIYVCVCVSY